jgi:2-hydroxychromene-2-carboxylate isomerase
MANQRIEDLPNVSRWYATVRARPAVERGIKLLIDQWVDVTKSEDARTNLFGDPQYESSRPSRGGPRGSGMTLPLTLYVDYRSPFSYLATEDARRLERTYNVRLKWLPFRTDLEGAYGGRVEQRTDRDWRKVRYLYQDARRIAKRRGLVVLGPQKIFDPRLAHIGMLLALDAGADVFRRYHDEVCGKFWRRELDIEDRSRMRTVVVEAGVEGAVFDHALATGEGDARCRSIIDEAEQRGVFGVPTFVFESTGELFWGTDRVWLLEERLREFQRAE